MSGNINVKNELCSKKTVGGDRFWILQHMVLDGFETAAAKAETL